MAYHITDQVVGSQAIATTDTDQLHPLGTIVRAYDPTYGEGEFIYLLGVASTAILIALAVVLLPQTPLWLAVLVWSLIGLSEANGRVNPTRVQHMVHGVAFDFPEVQVYRQRKLSFCLLP